MSMHMTDVTGVKLCVALGKLGSMGYLPRFISAEKQADMVSAVKKKNVIVGAAVGLRNGSIERAKKLVKAGADVITLDVAHGHMQKAIDTTKKLKQMFGRYTDLQTGMVATYQGAKDLFKAGANTVRAGVGPGTICITRTQTGVGVPQITAVMETARAAREMRKTIICEGGTKNSGDVVKGLAAGASAVVAGSQFAGTDEAPGKLVKRRGKMYKEYNASTSIAEKKKHAKKNNNLSKTYEKHIEGVESLVPYKGPVKPILEYTAANIRSGFSYAGAKNINEFWKKAKFVRITSSGVRESGSHDVILK